MQQKEARILEFNYHTHTVRCRHANGTDREYVEAAIQNGIKELGFSDHSPYIFPESFGDYYSGHRMRPELLENYCGSILALKNEYKSDISIHLGVEIEYYPLSFDQTYKFLKDAGVEYMLLGQHFTGNEIGEGSYYVCGGCSDRDDMLDEHTETVIMCIESGKFLYIAHPDIFYYKGDEAHYKENMLRIAKAAEQYNVPLEINLLGYSGGRTYPNIRFWEAVAETKAPVIFGADAHDPRVFSACDAYIAKWKKETAALKLNYVEKPLF